MNLLLNIVNADKPKWYFYIGIIAAILIAIFSMPQLIKTIKTKNTESVSLWTFILLVVGDLFFAIQGLGILCDPSMDSALRISNGLPLFLANLVSCTSSAIVLFFKVRNMLWAKRRGITETQLAENYKQIRADEKQAKLQRKMQKEQQKVKADAKEKSSETVDTVNV